jgi:hypothetical protein
MIEEDALINTSTLGCGPGEGPGSNKAENDKGCSLPGSSHGGVGGKGFKANEKSICEVEP